MTVRRLASVALLALAAVSGGMSAIAQQTDDPIGAAIANPPPAPAQPRSVGPTGPTAVPYNPLTPSPYNQLGGAYSRPPLSYGRPQIDTSGAPVHIDDLGKTTDRPLTSTDLTYDARLRASSASAQGMLGPLNGSWRLTIATVGEVYALELVDRGGIVEGAWRDLRRTGIGASGFIDEIQRHGSTLTLRFGVADGNATAIVSDQGDGRWTGELIDGTNRRSVTLRRN